jgi:hypothetical protein
MHPTKTAKRRRVTTIDAAFHAERHSGRLALHLVPSNPPSTRPAKPLGAEEPPPPAPDGRTESLGTAELPASNLSLQLQPAKAIVRQASRPAATVAPHSADHTTLSQTRSQAKCHRIAAAASRAEAGRGTGLRTDRPAFAMPACAAHHTSLPAGQAASPLAPAAPAEAGIAATGAGLVAAPQRKATAQKRKSIDSVQFQRCATTLPFVDARGEWVQHE